MASFTDLMDNKSIKFFLQNRPVKYMPSSKLAHMPKNNKIKRNTSDIYELRFAHLTELKNIHRKWDSNTKTKSSASQCRNSKGEVQKWRLEPTLQEQTLVKRKCRPARTRWSRINDSVLTTSQTQILPLSQTEVYVKGIGIQRETKQQTKNPLFSRVRIFGGNPTLGEWKEGEHKLPPD